MRFCDTRNLAALFFIATIRDEIGRSFANKKCFLLQKSCFVKWSARVDARANNTFTAGSTGNNREGSSIHLGIFDEAPLRLADSRATCSGRNCARGWRHTSCDRRRRRTGRRAKRDSTPTATPPGATAPTDRPLCTRWVKFVRVSFSTLRGTVLRRFF